MERICYEMIAVSGGEVFNEAPGRERGRSDEERRGEKDRRRTGETRRTGGREEGTEGPRKIPGRSADPRRRMLRDGIDSWSALEERSRRYDGWHTRPLTEEDGICHVRTSGEHAARRGSVPCTVLPGN